MDQTFYSSANFPLALYISPFAWKLDMVTGIKLLNHENSRQITVNFLGIGADISSNSSNAWFNYYIYHLYTTN